MKLRSWNFFIASGLFFHSLWRICHIDSHRTRCANIFVILPEAMKFFWRCRAIAFCQNSIAFGYEMEAVDLQWNCHVSNKYLTRTITWWYIRNYEIPISADLDADTTQLQNTTMVWFTKQFWKNLGFKKLQNVTK